MNKNNKKKALILSIIGLIGLIVVTIGITYAIFTYTKLGTTDNTVTSGTLKFLYTENTGVKTGIKLTNALPISDTQGKALDGDNNVFDFSIEATNTGTEAIPYEITLRKKNTSTLGEENVKVYLTDRTEATEKEELEPTNFNKLTQTNINVGNEVEKTIYKSSVAGGEVSYRKNFRLRMWIDEQSNQDDINGKEFTATVNVYANAELVTEQTKNLKSEIMKNSIIEAEPTLTTSSNNSSDASGLYKSTATNTGEATYYFRGNVENNYISFAGFIWRIVRINEDGTIRIIMQDGINDNSQYVFNPSNSNYTKMYYSNSNVKSILENWYNTNIGSNTNYFKYVASGNYYCEQAKVKESSSYSSGNATMEVYSNYIPSFKCSADGNNKGIVNASVGLITYDETIYAGEYAYQNNNDCYLYNNKLFWTMSPGGHYSSVARIWSSYVNGHVHNSTVSGSAIVRPVINLTSDIPISIGSGTSSDPFIVVN